MAEDTSRKILVTSHAVRAYQRRRHDHRPVVELAHEIEQLVRAAICDGHILNHKPKAFRLYKEKGKNLQATQRFVPCLERDDIGWIIRRDSGQDVVLTTLVRTAVAA